MQIISNLFIYLFLFILSFISDKNNLKITNKSKNNLQIDNKILCTYMKKLKNKNIKTVFIERIKSEVVLSVKTFYVTTFSRRHIDYICKLVQNTGLYIL